MDAGERDRLVRIQARGADGVDAEGGPVEVWTDLVDAYMSKDDPSARERFSRDQTSATFDSRFSMGYRADMDPELLDVPKLRRLIYQGRQYGIVGARQTERRAVVELLTVAQTRVEGSL